MGDRLIPFHLARQLSRRGYQIDLLAFYQRASDLADVPYYERYFQHVTLIREPMRAPHNLLARVIWPRRRFPTRRSQSWAAEMWQAIEERLALRRVYDVVHLFGGVQVYEFRHLVRDYPSLIAPYESYSLYLKQALAQASSPLQRLLLRLQLMMARQYESWMFEGFQRVVVVSDKDARMLGALNPGLRLEVIPNGVDVEHFTPTGHEPGKPVLLFTGNFAYWPNVDAAMRLIKQIFPQVKRAVPQAEVLIVGSNPPPELRALQGGEVHIAGHVPDLRPYFENALLYVSALRLGAGIKNKILEAMAMQTAVVATPLSCDGINVTHGQNVILAKRTEDLTKAVIRMLQDTRLRRQIAAGGRELVEKHYTWRCVANAYETLYETVIREHKDRAR